MGFEYNPDSQRVIDGQLVAYLRNGDKYICDYSSLSVCWHWLDRPVFRGREFTLAYGPGYHVSRVFVIGDDMWKQIDRKEYLNFFATLGLNLQPSKQ